MARNGLVYGVGKNDASYPVCSKDPISGKQIMCPFYRTWKNMLKRVGYDDYHTRNPTYSDCSVCEEWKSFSNFKAWMETQDWKGNQLDKDILFNGNKVYSPATCAFVSFAVNTFILENPTKRGEYMLGVSRKKGTDKLVVQVSNPFTKKYEHVGYFGCENEAHNAWLQRKLELAVELASTQTDVRVANALLMRYKKTE